MGVASIAKKHPATVTPPTATWIDTHTHLDDPVFAEDIDEVVGEAQAAGVVRFVNIGYCSERWGSTIDLMHRFPGNACAIGLHPGHADEWNDSTEASLRTAITRARAVAIGEIGIDLYREGPALALQREVMLRQFAIATELGLPVVIHQRAAEAELMDAAMSVPNLPRLLLHSFDGSSRYAEFARATSAMVGVGGLAARSSSVELREVLSRIPLEQIVLETDSPYLAPPGARGRLNTPASIPVIGRRVATLWGVTEDELATVTTANAERFFGFSDGFQDAGGLSHG